MKRQLILTALALVLLMGSGCAMDPNMTHVKVGMSVRCVSATTNTKTSKPTKCAKSVDGNHHSSEITGCDLKKVIGNGNRLQIAIHSGHFNERPLFYKLKTTR